MIEKILFGPKLTAYLTSAYAINIPGLPQNNNISFPPRTIKSHTILIRNDGFTTATNVVIKHNVNICLAAMPYPVTAAFTENTDGSVVFHNIPPRSYVYIAYVYEGVVTSSDIHYVSSGETFKCISYDDGIVPMKDGIEELSFPFWKRWYFWIGMLSWLALTAFQLYKLFFSA